MGRVARQQEARAGTRRAILDAALDLFVTAGYGQVSIRNIASRVGYSAGAIYSYFPSKDEIFFALAEEGFRLLGTDEQADAPGDDPIDDVRAAAWQLHQFSKDQPQYFALVFLDRQVPRISQAFERFGFIAEMRARVLAKVRRCVDQGALPPDTPPDLAMRLLWASVVGIAALRLSARMPPDLDTDALVRDAIDTTIAGLRAGAPRHTRLAAESAMSQALVGQTT
jgi:AcrR family transcriptional regulator